MNRDPAAAVTFRQVSLGKPSTAAARLYLKGRILRTLHLPTCLYEVLEVEYVGMFGALPCGEATVITVSTERLGLLLAS